MTANAIPLLIAIFGPPLLAIPILRKAGRSWWGAAGGAFWALMLNLWIGLGLAWAIQRWGQGLDYLLLLWPVAVVIVYVVAIQRDPRRL